MQLIIDGKRAVLKNGSSFDYVSENRAFSDSDNYTLAITLPLADCAENLDIFGHIDRMDADSRHIVLPASIVDREFSKSGVVTVVDSTETEVKCQFLEGRSVQNFLTTFDDIYINELSLGNYPTFSLPLTVTFGNIDQGANSVALPWVNDSAEGFLNNEVLVDSTGKYQWGDTTKEIGKLSYMPYLIYIAKRVCDKVGYTYEFSEWEASDDRHLLICNVLPASWDIPQFARALPHWSVSEFFSELEKVLCCDFNIDHREKHIDVKMSTSFKAEDVLLENVVDTFSTEVSYEDSLCQYKGLANLSYADRGDSQWKQQQSQWLVERLKLNGTYYKEFQTEKEFNDWLAQNGMSTALTVTEKDQERGIKYGSLFHIVESGRYCMYKVIDFGGLNQTYVYSLITINQFAEVIKSLDSDNDIQLQCIPARIDSTDYEHGNCLFLGPASYNEKECTDDNGIRQPVAYSTYLLGDTEETAEYYDKLYLAYWDGTSANITWGGHQVAPCPFVDERFSLKLRYKNYMEGRVINPKEKLKVSFLSSTIPDARSVFYIRGKKYLCEKITATFTENGMSQLLKGEFYALVES